jgi:Cu/Ag efflux protein CusF
MKRLSLWFAALAFGMVTNAHAAGPVIEVFKSATCGCCAAWVEHLRANGFETKVNDVSDPSAYRARFGVPNELGACHTAVVDGYAIEGHVPAREIKRLLAERPKARGLAVPGMPLGSPGMEGARVDPYNVLLIGQDSTHRVYAQYGAATEPTRKDDATRRADAGKQNTQAALTDGEIRKVDKEGKKVTIKHGPIQNLDMPAMTMAFQVRDQSMLEQIKTGDKVKFQVEKIGGAFVVTRIEK